MTRQSVRLKDTALKLAVVGITALLFLSTECNAITGPGMEKSVHSLVTFFPRHCANQKAEA